MSIFQHHPDGFIFINDISFSLDWFLTQEPNYSGLPEDAIGRLYVPTKRHHITIMKGDTPTQFPGEIDENHLWAEGDRYIANVQTYVDAYELFIHPPITKEQKDEQFNNGVDNDLYVIDIKSIRSIREWIVTQNNAPQQLKDYEYVAASKRAERK